MTRGWFKIEILLVAMLFTSLVAFCQTGSYFMTHYNPAEENFDNTNFSIAQDGKGVMHIANRQGILHYDGNGWWLTSVPFSVYSLADYGAKTFVGGREGFGYIENVGPEKENYIAIDTISRDVTKIIINQKRGYYLSEDKLFSFLADTPVVITELQTGKIGLIDLTLVKGRVLVSTDQGLREIDQDSNKLREIEFAPEGSFFVRTSASGRILFLTDSSKIYTQTKGKTDSLKALNRGYLEDHTITEVVWATDSLIAIGTLSGGILFADALSGETVQIVDYDTGLPDNQITSLFVDRSGGLWAAHPNGFSVIAPGLPLRSYNYYPGLKGSLVSVLSFNDNLYVGTSTGVFRLSEVKKVRERVVYDRVRIRVEASQQEPIDESQERKGLFGWRKNKEKEKAASGPEYKYVYRSRVVEEELSRSYEYQKVGGINAKCNQLMEYNNRLFAGTLQGAFEIREDSAYQIVQAPTLHMYGVKGQKLAFISTMEEEVEVLSLGPNTWQKTNMLAGLSDYIEQIAQDPEGNIWLCGADSLYRIVLENSTLVDVEVYSIDNPYFDKIYTTNYSNKILFVNSTGYFGYEDLTITRQDDIEDAIGLPKRFILGAQGQLLVNTGNSWYGAGNNLRTSLNFLSFFKDPRAIARDKQYNYWVTTATNDLYRVNIQSLSNLSGEDEIFLKEVRSNNKKIPLQSQLNIDQESSQLTFEFASPDYTGIYSKEYRYRLRNAGGTSSSWSEWSTNNNVISYQFLPPGAYTLEASFRNALGKEVTAEPFKFRVVAPYWKRPWFYVLEVAFFSGLLLFSFYLNRGRGKYVVISRLLGFLTLILIVEFFQTVAEYYYESGNSPVINFFIQAFIALLILPVESVLRHYLTRNPDELKEKT
jgi:hypothetical protein